MQEYLAAVKYKKNTEDIHKLLVQHEKIRSKMAFKFRRLARHRRYVSMRIERKPMSSMLKAFEKIQENSECRSEGSPVLQELISEMIFNEKLKQGQDPKVVSTKRIKDKLFN